MKRPLAFALGAAVAASLPVVGLGLARAADDDVAQLIAIDKQQQRAYIDRDVAALNRIFTDDYMLVNGAGREWSKAELLSIMASPDSHWEINETSGWKVRVHGDTAIVVATLRQKGVLQGKPFNSTVKFSDTYVRENGVWRNVHGHSSRSVPVEEKPANKAS